MRFRNSHAVHLHVLVDEMYVDAIIVCGIFSTNSVFDHETRES